MSDALQSLVTGSSTPPTEIAFKRNNEGRFSSALAHLATSLAVAIILGAAAALTAYFLTHGITMWTAVAGGGGAVVSGLITYVILRCAFGRSSQNVHPTPLETPKEAPHAPEWLSKLLLTRNLQQIPFEVDDAINFESLREEMTAPVALLKGKTTAIALDLQVQHTDHTDASYRPPGRAYSAEIPSSSNFRTLIVIANNANGKWRLIPEVGGDILHRKVVYRISNIFEHGGQMFFDSTPNPKINLDQEEVPAENKLPWLLSRLLTGEPAKIPEFKVGLFRLTGSSNRVGTWEIRLNGIK